MTTTNTLLIVGAAAVGVWFLFLRDGAPMAAGPASAAAAQMPAGNTAAAYPGGTRPLPGPVYTGPGAILPTASPPLNNPPNYTSPSRLFSLGSPTAAAGDLGSSIVPGNSVGTGSALGYIAGRIFANKTPMRAPLVNGGSVL